MSRSLDVAVRTSFWLAFASAFHTLAFSRILISPEAREDSYYPVTVWIFFAFVAFLAIALVLSACQHYNSNESSRRFLVNSTLLVSTLATWLAGTLLILMTADFAGFTFNNQTWLLTMQILAGVTFLSNLVRWLIRLDATWWTRGITGIISLSWLSILVFTLFML